MAKSTKPAAADGAEAVEETAGGGKKKILMLALPLIALVAGWFFLMGPGAGGEAEAKEPVKGEVLELEPITMNLADGRLLKVGLALQVNAEPSSEGHGEVTGAVALDTAISYLGEHTFDQLADPATRETVKTELSHRVAERYHHDVLEVYFTEFVMQ